MKTKVIIAAHKKYEMPKDPMYLPVQVGSFGRDSLGYQRDDQGDNISEKNPYYCELTGLYWAWKNLDCDYLGLAHYRRHFKGSSLPLGVLSQCEVEQLLQKTDCILPTKQHYIIETIYSHYEHTHYEEDIMETRKVIEEIYPQYLDSFDRHMKNRSSHMFNMFIMKKELVDGYCTFLFDVLAELEKRIDVTKYDKFQARVFGRIGEILLDIWLDHNHISYIEVPVVYMERINWIRKCSAFLQAKFFHKRYKGSF